MPAEIFRILETSPGTGIYASVPGGDAALYGTCYALLAQVYLGDLATIPDQAVEFILDTQREEEECYFVGPEMRDWSPSADARHDREHLLLHLACAALPVLQQFGVKPRYPLVFARRFCDINYLGEWLDSRKMQRAWLEGNNLLFVGQLLVYLRDDEKYPGAEEALDTWFSWLASNVDPATGVWGSDKGATRANAVFGGYHQLLVYYYEDREIQFNENLIDVVLALQHDDGGFLPKGGGGACEDVDAVDILVNLYKKTDYRHAEIRLALRKCLKHILALQNDDGGYPYKKRAAQNHMGIPGTIAPPNVSTAFATWFRIHTIALIAEILTDELPPQEFEFGFSKALSMGWHRPWVRGNHQLTSADRIPEISALFRAMPRRTWRRAKALGRRAAARVGPR